MGRAFQLPMAGTTLQSSVASSTEMSEVQAAIGKLQIKADGNNQITAKLPKAVDITALTKLTGLFSDVQRDFF